MPRAHTYVRPLSHAPDDVALAEYVMNHSGNDFPASYFTLPSTQIMVAEHDGAPILVQPFYRALVLGSLAWTGQPTAAEMAAAQHAMTAAAYTDCHRYALSHIIAFSNTESTRKFALRHGYHVPAHPAIVQEVR